MRWPFNKKSAAPVVEEKSLPAGTGSGDTDLYELFAGGTSTFGVSQGQALSVPAVQACIRAISEAVATAPLALRRKVGGEEVDVDDHPALPLVTRQANAWTDSFSFIRDLVAQALTSDAGGLAWVNRVRSKPMEIISYVPGSISVEYDSKGTQEPTYRLAGKKIKSGDVIHVRGAFSRCPLNMARDSIAVAWTIEQHIGQLFKQGARPGGVITTPKPVGEKGVVNMLAGWKAAFEGANNSGRTALLYDGASWNPMTFSSVDSQTLELLKEANLQIARAFRVPPSMIYELSRMTWSNFEAAGRDWITYSLLPWLRAVEGALDRALLTDDERGEYGFRFDVDDTTQADLTARATAVSTLVTNEILSPNDARDWLGMPPRDGGDVYRNPAINVTPPANTKTPPDVANAA
jgi:HK97 family phage portal protein